MWQIDGALNEIPSSQDAYVTHILRFLITSRHLGMRASTENYLILIFVYLSIGVWRVLKPTGFQPLKDLIKSLRAV